jgi:hypothetical protein
MAATSVITEVFVVRPGQLTKVYEAVETSFEDGVEENIIIRI